MLSYDLLKTLHEDRVRTLRGSRPGVFVPRVPHVRIRVRSPKAAAR
jgi:hypothetical protein